MKHRTKLRGPSGLALAAALVIVFGSTLSIPAQQSFASPEEALSALARAAKAKDHNAFAAIFGPRIRDFVSGDPVADTADYDKFAADIAKSARWEKVTEQKLTLVIGDDQWPFAAPLVKLGGNWQFDTNTGVEEMLNRRIGMNEYYAMNLCQVYAIAQFEYFNGDDWDGDQVSEYAQKISSSPGKRDGLYWKSAGTADESPLGALFAYAALDGYTAKTGTTRSAAPLYGYNFKVLYGQGRSAPGGKFGYIINGNLIAGFALVAYPATWGNSGVMTFIVNQEGRVYEKNLGPDTKAIAESMREYDPDVTWKLVPVN